MRDDLPSAFTEHVESLTGELVERVARRSRTILAFTESSVVKLFTEEPLYRTRTRFEWLTRTEVQGCRLDIVDLGRAQRYATLTMERLPGRFRLDVLLNATSIDPDCIDRVVERLAQVRHIIQPPPLPATTACARMVENIEKQSTLLRGDVLAAHASRVLTEGRRILAIRIDASWVPVVHGDLHAENVFVLPDRVVLIDPVFTEPRARTAPFFTELAPLYTDILALHDESMLEKISGNIPVLQDQPSRSIFLLSACLKLLVRYRTAKQLPERPDPSIRSSVEWYSGAHEVASVLDTVLAEVAGDSAYRSRSY
jgi:hypothetical protein